MTSSYFIKNTWLFVFPSCDKSRTPIMLTQQGIVLEITTWKEKHKINLSILHGMATCTAAVIAGTVTWYCWKQQLSTILVNCWGQWSEWGRSLSALSLGLPTPWCRKKASQNCVDLSMCPRGLGQVCAVQALGTWCLLPSHGTPSNGSRGPQNVSICCNQKGGQDRKGEWLYISQSKYLHRFTDSKPGSNLTRLHSQLSANIHWALTMCHALCQVLEKKRSKNS